MVEDKRNSCGARWCPTAKQDPRAAVGSFVAFISSPCWDRCYCERLLSLTKFVLSRRLEAKHITPMKRSIDGTIFNRDSCPHCIADETPAVRERFGTNHVPYFRKTLRFYSSAEQPLPSVLISFDVGQPSFPRRACRRRPC